MAEKETHYWTMDPKNIQQENKKIAEAASFLQAGEVVAFPTETVYGLGADATNSDAVAKIFQAKGRPADNPLIVHVAEKAQIKEYVTEIPHIAEKLIDAFMPGPLTVILKSNQKIASLVTAGLDTLAIRIPDHTVARALIEASQRPLAAPSANTSGKPSPTKAIHVAQDLHQKIAGIVDGGEAGVGVESTVIDCTGDLPLILRPGGVTKEEIEAIVGEVLVDQALEQSTHQPKAPGMKYNHYEPDAPLYLIEGDSTFFQAQIDQLTSKQKNVGVIASEELAKALQASHIKSIGARSDLKTIAKHLYDALRFFNEKEIDVIVCETFTDQGVGQAIMNRLQKAATKEIKQ